MIFLEKDLEETIYRYSQSYEGREMLSKAGLRIFSRFYRQVDLGGYGRIDLLSAQYLNKTFILTVYELKKGKVGVKAFLQSCKYMEALKEIAKVKTNKMVEIRIVLIGDSIDDDEDFKKAYEYLDYLTIIIYKQDALTGIKFQEVPKNYEHWNHFEPQQYSLPVSELREMAAFNKIEIGF